MLKDFLQDMLEYLLEDLPEVLLEDLLEDLLEYLQEDLHEGLLKDCSRVTLGVFLFSPWYVSTAPPSEPRDRDSLSLLQGWSKI